MASFTYNEYQNVVARAQGNQNNSANSVKVGFFKLKADGDSALIRINCSNTSELQFASVHQLGAETKWMKIGCLNEVGSYSDNCPLCAAVAAGNTAIGKAKKQVFVQMMCSYIDPTTGAVTAAIPVIWERPAGFANDLNGKIRDYGDLRNVVFKVTRHGAARDPKTTYSIDYLPLYDKTEYVPADFSAFTNFNIAKHSFWEKTADEINAFLETGSFPEVVRNASQVSAPIETKTVSQTYVQTTPVQPAQTYVAPTPVTPAPATATTEEKPKPKFGNFSF